MKEELGPRMREIRVAILLRLLEGPVKSNDLWTGVNEMIGISKRDFYQAHKQLYSEDVICRIPSRKFVFYSLSPNADSRDTEELTIARNIAKYAPVELILEAMEIIAFYKPQIRDGKYKKHGLSRSHNKSSSNPNNFWIFLNDEQRVQAAVDFWVDNYRNFSVLAALSSLRRENSDQSPFEIRKLYQAVEDKYFDILVRFQKKVYSVFEKTQPYLFRTALGKKLANKEVNLEPGWVRVKLAQFLQDNYPEAYEKLDEKDKDKIYLALYEKSKEKEFVKCDKGNKVPKWFCKKFCNLQRSYPSVSCKPRQHLKIEINSKITEKH